MSVLPDAPSELPRLLGYRRRDFARALGVSLPTVERWISAGEVRAVKIGGTIIIPAGEAARVLGYEAPSGGSDAA
jgi:excisionase family DNA binding protein